MTRDYDALAQAIGSDLPLPPCWRGRALIVFWVTTGPLVFSMLHAQRWLYDRDLGALAWPIAALNRRFMVVWSWLHAPELARLERERRDRLARLTGRVGR
jgi:hypothetical protein